MTAAGKTTRADGWRRRLPVLAGGVFLVALTVRLALIAASPGGLGGDYGYDPGVYYAAAASLLGGQVPYGGFTLLHPPGLMLVLTPFAELGQLTTDHTGFVVACLAFVVVGAVNAALVTAIGRRSGWRPAASLGGGLFYAVWFGTASTEVGLRLEPLGNLAFLLGLFWLAGRPGRPGGRSLVLAGVALGFAVCVKIWWIVPVAVVLVALVRRSRRAALTVLAAAVAAAVVVCGPFFLAAPSAMWHMVITEQLGRPGNVGPLARVAWVTAVHTVDPRAGHALAVPVLLVCVLGLALLVRAAWRAPEGRVVTVLAIAQVLVVALSPSFFYFYSAFLGAGLALLVGAAVAGGARDRAPATTRRGRTGVAAGVATAVLLGSAALTVAAAASGHAPGPGRSPAPLAARVSHIRCLMTDTPIILVDLDALTRTIDNHCPNWVDVTGRTYGPDAPTRPHEKRPQNRRWQADIRRYLLSGDAVITARGNTGLSAATKAYLRRHTRPFARYRGWEIRLVRR